MTCIVHPKTIYLRLCDYFTVSSSFLTFQRGFTSKYRRAMPPETEAHFRVLDMGFFNFTFVLPDTALQKNRACVFQRKIEEPVEKLLHRISAKINDAGSKKKKKKKDDGPEMSCDVEKSLIPVEFLKNGIIVSSDVLCSELFEEDQNDNLQFKIGDIQYKVFVNRPWINFVTLPAVIMAGFPVYPYKLELKYSNWDDSEFLWSRISNVSVDEPEIIANSLVYTPSTQDIGSYLKLTCIPKRDDIVGENVTCFSNSVIDAGPGVCPFEERHLFTQENLKDDSFRVVSYNILADLYASSETGKNSLFTYCPPYAMQMDYRKLLLLKELIGYNADLIFLQEVDVKVFMRDLNHVLNAFGFSGILTKKGGQVNEGEACFYRKNRFKLISDHSLVLGEQSRNEDCLKEIWEAVQLNENLYTRIKDKNTVVQILVLEYLDKPNHKLIVGNTHLYFHPEADHVRMLQAGICLNLVNHLKIKIKSEEPDCTVSVVFAGDFNSTPECGVYELFTNKHISEDHNEWKSDKSVEVHGPGVKLYNPINFDSACGTPEFTNFTPFFSGCLDYIFYETDYLTVERTAPFPDKSYVSQHTAIPSIVFPSDHLSLVADLRWKD